MGFRVPIFRGVQRSGTFMPQTAPGASLLGRLIQGYLAKGIQTPMAQGRSTKIISMIKQIQTSRLSMKNSLSACPHYGLQNSFKRSTCRGKIEFKAFAGTNLVTLPPRILGVFEGKAIFSFPGTKISTIVASYRSTLFITNTTLLGPYSRSIPRVPWWS